MNPKRNKLVFIVVVTVTLCVPPAFAAPPSYTDNINAVPDLTQTDPKADFPGGGSQFCLHCAVTNSLMWLDSSGFPNLVDNTSAPFADQVNLAKLLASESYMDTNLEQGTGTTKLLRGIRKYIADCGYEIQRLDYRGWRWHQADVFHTGLRPDLNCLKTAVSQNAAVWLNIGWYKYHPSEDTYERIAGHWVTLVGYGKDENGNLNPNILIVHDPSPRSGMDFANEYVLATRITSGALNGPWKNLPKNAAGFYKLTDRLHIKPPADSAVIDGVVILKLKSPATTQTQKQENSPAPSTFTAESPPQMLDEVRTLLTGKNKNTAAAKKILLDLEQNYSSALNPTELCYVYVYLGYIEDLARNRAAAVPWFKKALPLEGPNIKWIKQLAEEGINKPVTWIRHLDQPEKTASKEPRKTRFVPKNIIERIGAAYVTGDRPPGDLSPKMRLSKAQHLQNFEILCRAIDKYYSFFEHKKIDWDKIIAQYRPKVQQAKTTEDFYLLMYQLIRELNDFHSWLCNYTPPTELPRYSPPLSIRKVEGKAVVCDVDVPSPVYDQGIRKGSVILEVDGLPVEQTIEKLRPAIRIYSSERAFQEIAYRRLLDGKRNTQVTVKFLPPQRQSPFTTVLTRTARKDYQLPVPPMDLTKEQFVWSGRLPSGFGYIRILSFGGRGEIADRFDRALESLKDTQGLIIDVRENMGGFGTSHHRIIGRLITERTRVSISYLRNGLAHTDFERHESYFASAGDWQYTKPVAMLINPVTGSAADLFAARMISTGRILTVGTPTHGNLTGKGIYVVLPCRLAARISNGYVCDASGEIIETNGNSPDVHAELSIADIINGADSVLTSAVAELKRLTE